MLFGQYIHCNNLYDLRFRIDFKDFVFSGLDLYDGMFVFAVELEQRMTTIVSLMTIHPERVLNFAQFPALKLKQRSAV